MVSSEKLWKTLYSLAPIRRAKPCATLYEVIVDRQDLGLARRYIDGGHALSQRFAGGHSLSLAVRHGDLDFVRFFIENALGLDQAKGLDAPSNLLESAVERLHNAGDEDLETAMAVFAYLLRQPFARKQMASAFAGCASRGQISAARMLLDAGVGDEDVKVGPKKTVKLSTKIASMGSTQFASLLRGEQLDLEHLERAELKERRQNAKLNSALAGLTATDGDNVLAEPGRTERYTALVAEISSGDWDNALDSTDPHRHRSPLEFAAEHGLVELLTNLLEHGHLPAGSTQAAAVAAATHGHLDVIKELQAHSVAVEATKGGKNSPLSEACRYGNLEIVRYLLGLGANPNSGDGSGHEFTLDDLAGGEKRSQIIAALEAHRKGFSD